MCVTHMEKNVIHLCVRLQGQKEFVYSSSTVFRHAHARIKHGLERLLDLLILL